MGGRGGEASERSHRREEGRRGGGGGGAAAEARARKRGGPHRPFGEKAVVETSREWPSLPAPPDSKVAVSSHVPRSSRIAPAPFGTASVSPCGCQHTPSCCAEPGSTRPHTESVLTVVGSSRMSQMRTVPSADDEARYSPFGSNARHRTESVCPLTETNCDAPAPLALTMHMRMAPSSAPTAAIRPLGSSAMHRTADCIRVSIRIPSPDG